MESRKSALMGILLVGFIPSISVIFGIKILEDELSSQVFFIVCKIMIFVIPTIWYIKIDNNPISFIFPSNEGIKIWNYNRYCNVLDYICNLDNF